MVVGRERACAAWDGLSLVQRHGLPIHRSSHECQALQNGDSPFLAALPMLKPLRIRCAHLHLSTTHEPSPPSDLPDPACAAQPTTNQPLTAPSTLHLAFLIACHRWLQPVEAFAETNAATQAAADSPSNRPRTVGKAFRAGKTLAERTRCWRPALSALGAFTDPLALSHPGPQRDDLHRLGYPPHASSRPPLTSRYPRARSFFVGLLRC